MSGPSAATVFVRSPPPSCSRTTLPLQPCSSLRSSCDVCSESVHVIALCRATSTLRTMVGAPGGANPPSRRAVPR